MPPHTQLTESNLFFVLLDPQTKYQLQIGFGDFINPCEQVTFRIPLHKKHIAVTGRDFKDYTDMLGLTTIYHGYQHLEVGAGVGGFITHLATFSGRFHRPIIIDPVDYTSLRSLLETGLKERSCKKSHKRMGELLRRIDIIQNPDLVRLVNLRLSEAIQEQPNLTQCADVVLDIYGPSYHYSTEMPKGPEREALYKIRELETQLLKPGGTLLQWR